MNKKTVNGFKIKQNDNRKRAELTLPTINYHQWESWRPTLEKIQNGTFDAYQTLFTLADRRSFPNQTVVQHYDYKGLAKKFLCSDQKAIKIIKVLYEVGLVDIYEGKNIRKGPSNVVVVNSVPYYADSTFCKLKQARKWDERKSRGQLISKLAGQTSAIKKKILNSRIKAATKVREIIKLQKSSVKITLDNKAKTSVKITLVNQRENHTIYNNTNTNNNCLNNNRNTDFKKSKSWNYKSLPNVVVVNTKLQHQRTFYSPTIEDINYLVNNFTVMNIFTMLNDWGLGLSIGNAIYYYKHNTPNLVIRDLFDLSWTDKTRYEILKNEIRQLLTNNTTVATLEYTLLHVLGYETWSVESKTVSTELLQSILSKKSITVISETLAELKRQYDECNHKDDFFQKSLGAWLYSAFFKTRIVLQKPTKQKESDKKFDSVLMC